MGSRREAKGMALRATISRRLAGETGAVRKDHGGRLRVCLVYPNTYRVGMSSLGFQAVYHLLNTERDVVCERAFIPDREDLEDLHRTGEELVSYESQTPLGRFDVIAFSVSYELDYVHVARALRLAKVSPLAADRGRAEPLVIAGGAAVSINPEPLADLVDAVVLGEAEEAVAEAVSAVLRSGGDRAGSLDALASVGGVYVPERAAAPPKPRAVRRYIEDLDAWPTHSRLLTREAELGDLFLVEVSRGCARRCRFCVTPACYWPPRWRSAESVLGAARAGLEHRDAIGLVGAAVSDHPEVDDIARGVVALGARLSVSSLRADSVSDVLLDALARGGARAITIAPEAGTERLRRAIGKPIRDEALADVLARAVRAGLREAKLYFMVGLPGEQEEDVEAIPALVRRLVRGAGLRRATVAAGAFVPKPETPFEGEAMLPARELSRRLRAVRDALRAEPRVRLALESANWSVIEGVLSRGDRRLGRVIVRAEELGGNLAGWRAALAEAGLDLTMLIGPRPKG